VTSNHLVALDSMRGGAVAVVVVVGESRTPAAAAGDFLGAHSGAGARREAAERDSRAGREMRRRYIGHAEGHAET
jgi:hypothetical protein